MNFDTISHSHYCSHATFKWCGLTIGIIVARYNWPITGALLALGYQELLDLGVAVENIHVVHVPGSYELAPIAQAMLTHDIYDALICIGCVMKGETRHDVIVGDSAAQGIQRVALDTGVPIILGVLCAENQQQAKERIPRGQEFAQAAVEVACTSRLLRQKR
ncbi:6,7-dimethyl-8-ribityllumazine synthase [Dictyobacter kobayashii]|uniref:6,7-dimethyl-8-ribityllumazine synthase n=1 Tax=Dictyobacter kobayashii TaxID=2014872 RepID=A0A402ABA0_9CHLR|nr:6,7-dimethyl-8-ribityllumazine synthase [Dictyobacter kobayashii]GCE16255.1 6,7-dimethyl-8-ribityllumazine synthase [Dictyobacter kobayashii]